MTNSKRALGRLLGGASVAALSMAVLLPAGAFAQEATATNQAGAAPAAPAADPAALQPQASGGPAATQEAGPVGFKLDLAHGRAIDHQGVYGPDRPV